MRELDGAALERCVRQAHAGDVPESSQFADDLRSPTLKVDYGVIEVQLDPARILNPDTLNMRNRSRRLMATVQWCPRMCSQPRVPAPQSVRRGAGLAATSRAYEPVEAFAGLRTDLVKVRAQSIIEASGERPPDYL